jgi:hypothetical protein
LSASAIALTDVKCHGHALGQDVQPTLHSRASPYYLVIHRSLSLSLLPRTHCRHLHAWTGVFEAWRTSCWYRHHSREQQPSGHIKIYFVALRYWVGRLRYGELREHDPSLSAKCRVFSFSKLFYRMRVHTGWVHQWVSRRPYTFVIFGWRCWYRLFSPFGPSFGLSFPFSGGMYSQRSLVVNSTLLFLRLK